MFDCEPLLSAHDIQSPSLLAANAGQGIPITAHHTQPAAQRRHAEPVGELYRVVQDMVGPM